MQPLQKTGFGKQHVIFVQRFLPSLHLKTETQVHLIYTLTTVLVWEIEVIYFMLQFGNRCHIKLKASKSFNFENTHYQRETRNIVFAAGVHPFK